nr:hypothetical protein [Streptomyces sp. QL37]
MGTSTHRRTASTRTKAVGALVAAAVVRVLAVRRCVLVPIACLCPAGG